ncbi:AAA family ATPase [Haliangium ochraceum]|uniref:SMC domain protein n=1 Tax=Haliangium ochraceum (strain DSM 14365 / JCM 11303 / SMP-2) TaxID=502025 RepID=D0LJL7_HALO1|nr:ATP-binding protein [Haliangium ochraceum]ACY16591.1 SMC domain protein [Haliangium ochraceum DSM 14365]
MLLHLSLKNFKSFRKAEIPLGPLTLLVGANASGKSNIRDALRILHGIGLRYSLAEVLGEKYGPGGILQWRGIRGGRREAAFRDSGEFSLELSFTTGPETGYGFRVEVDVTDEHAGPRVTAEGLHWGYSDRDYDSRERSPETTFPVYDPVGLESDSYLYHSNPADDPVEQRGAHRLLVRHPRGGRYRSHGKISDMASIRPALTQIPEDAKAPAQSRDACTSTLKALQSIRFLDLDPEAMRQPSQPGQVTLNDRGENLSSVLQEICNDERRKQILLQWLRALTPMDAVDFEFISDFQGRVLVHLVESGGYKVSALSASDGTLRFLALVAALLSADTGRIYFFEELDNGLHPTRLHLLLQLIKQACEEEGVQVIATTHNPALLAFLDKDALGDALLIHRDERRADSRVCRIVDLPDIQRILASQDLGRLHAAGWLEDAAVFSQEDDDEDDDDGEDGT